MAECLLYNVIKSACPRYKKLKVVDSTLKLVLKIIFYITFQQIGEKI